MEKIKEPFINGFCKECENSDNGCHCFAKKLYGRPVPTFAVVSCDEYKDKKENAKNKRNQEV